MTDNNMINATIDCEAFIVPNRAARADQRYSMGKSLATKAAEIAANNGFEYNEETDKFVQMWWVGAGSDNMQDHGFCIDIENEKYFFGYQRSIELVPMKFFEGHKEGEVLPLTITLRPVAKMDINIGRESRISFDEENPAPTFQITFNIKLNQLDYRYRRFGTFEEVLKMVA